MTHKKTVTSIALYGLYLFEKIDIEHFQNKLELEVNGPGRNITFVRLCDFFSIYLMGSLALGPQLPFSI